MEHHRTFKRPRFAGLSDSAKLFVKSLLTVDPGRRMSAMDALKHPWILESNRPQVQIDPDVLLSMRNLSQASRFRRVCLSLLAWSLSGQDLIDLRASFERIDTDRSGTVSLQEVKAVLEDQYHIDSTDAQAIFLSLDTDGEICYSDFLAAAMHDHVCCLKASLKEAFGRLDMNGTGAIATEDLRGRLRVYDRTITGPEIDELIRRIDRDGQGAITFEAFFEYLRQPAEAGEYSLALALADAVRGSASGTSLSFTVGSRGGVLRKKPSHATHASW